MAAMTVGAIVCNAGIAAVLGHIIGNVDRMAGTCRRNLESALHFCRSRKVSSPVQSLILGYQQYVVVCFVGVMSYVVCYRAMPVDACFF